MLIQNWGIGTINQQILLVNQLETGLETDQTNSLTKQYIQLYNVWVHKKEGVTRVNWNSLPLTAKIK